MFSAAASAFQGVQNPFARSSGPAAGPTTAHTGAAPLPASGGFASAFVASAARQAHDAGTTPSNSGGATDGGDDNAFGTYGEQGRSRRSFSRSMFRGGGSGSSGPPPPLNASDTVQQQRGRQSTGSALLGPPNPAAPGSNGRPMGGVDRRRTSTTFGVLGGRSGSTATPGGAEGHHAAAPATAVDQQRPSQAPPSPPPPPSPVPFSSSAVSHAFPVAHSAVVVPLATGRGGAAVMAGRGRGRGRGRGVSATPGSAVPGASPEVVVPAFHATHSLTKLFVLFLQKVVAPTAHGISTADQAAERDAQAGTMLEHAFFKFNWKTLPAHVLHEMLAAVQRMRPADIKTRLERWAVVFFLGCNVNMLERAAWEGGGGGTSEDNSLVRGEEGDDEAHTEHRQDGVGSSSTPSWQSVLRLALERANILCETFGELFVDSRRYAGDVPHESPEHVVPYSALRIVLRRIRATFERAAAAGFHDVMSMEAQLLSLVVRRDSPQNGSMFQPLAHAPESKMHAEIARTIAALVCEYACLKNSTEMVRQLQFAESYHTWCPDDHATRCALYFRVAQMIVQLAPLNTQNLSSARQNLARSLPLCDAGDHKLRLAILSWFTAVSLALGMVPPSSSSSGATEDDDSWSSEYAAVTDLFGGIVTALRCADLALYERVLEERLPQFVECGFGSLMEHVRVHVRTNVVLAYFLSLGRPTKLPIHGLLDFAGPLPAPFHDVQGMCRLWLLPLLMERLINGAVDAEANVLILGQARPFELYDVTALPT